MRHSVLSLVIALALLIGAFVVVQAQSLDEQEGPVATTTGTSSIYQGDGLDLVYTVTISDPSSHLVHIRLDIGNVSTDTMFLARKKGEQIPNILNLIVTNQDGVEIPHSLESLSSVELLQVQTSNASTITVVYDANLTFTETGGVTGQSFWVLDSAFGLVGPILIFYQPVADAQVSSIRLYFDLPAGWDAVTRFQETDGYYQPDPNDVMTWWEGGVAFPFFLFGSMAFGDFDCYTRTVGGIDVLVAFYSDDDAEENMIAQRVFATLEYASSTLGALPEGTGQDGFVYVFHDGTHGNVHGGMHEFGQITGMDVGSVEHWRGMAHMIFHNWFVEGPEMPLWRPFHVVHAFTENSIQFYALRSAGETGIWDASRVNDHLLGWYNDYANYILGTEYDVPLTREDLWFQFPNDPLPSLYDYGILSIFWYEKGPLILDLLNWRIEDVTQGEKSLDDAWRLLHDHRPGYSAFKGGSLTADDILEAVEYTTGHDFSDFWEAYVSGAQPLPFHIVDGWLTVDASAVPDAPALSNLELVRLSLKWSEGESDTDDDGLTDYVEDLIGTDSQMADTDQDGLRDRGEFGVIVDGQPGEYGLDQPLITDSQGDSLSSEPGTDIERVDAKTFINENGDRELYLVMSTWDNQYNPDAWYEILLENEVYGCQFRLDEHQLSYHLWCKENDNPEVEIPPERIDVQFEELLEVKIPLDLLPRIGTTFSATGLIRYGEDEIPEHGLKNVDTADWATTSTASRIFITDPLNPDTDGDGVSDGLEVLFGSDPTDASDTVTVWPVSLPIVLRSH